MKKTLLAFGLIGFISLCFFYKTIIFGLLPIPADALVGMYHPFRDYFVEEYPNGVPYKNYLLTDPVLQQYPWKWLAIENGKDNPYNFSGTSLLSNIQAGVFYPLNLLFFLGSFELIWSVYIAIQPILAGVLMALWLREKKLHPIVWSFGGLVWAFSSFNLVWLEWGNIGHAGLWLPLALLSIDRLRTSFKWHLSLQLALVASLFAGHIQVTLYLLMAVGLYLVINLLTGVFLTHCFLFLILTSIQWVPTLRFALDSNRAVEQQDVLSRDGFFLEPKQLIQSVIPDYFGNPATQNYRGAWNYAEQVVYLGLIPLILALAVSVKDYPWRTKDNPLKTMRVFSLFLVFGGLLLAVRNPLAELPYRLHLPFWSSLQPTRLSYLITFGLSILAALGMEGLIRSPKLALRRLTIGAIAAIGVIGFAWLTAGQLNSPAQLVARRNLVLPTGMIIGAIGGIGVLKKVPESFSLLIPSFLLVLTVVDLFRFGWKFTPFSPRDYLYPLTPAIEYLQKNMEEKDRYLTVDRRILPPNANIIYRLKSVEGYDPIYNRDYALLITRMETGDETDQPANFGRIVRPGNWRSPIARQLGVRYVLSLDEMEDVRLRKVFQEGETRVYEITN